MTNTIYIYCYQNNINGKLYIGQTIDIVKRDRQHISSKKNYPIDSALRKYGRNAFQYWIVCIANSIDEANELEIYWIKELRDQLGKKMLYNLRDGGLNGGKHSDETNKKISMNRKGKCLGEKNGFFGKTHTAEVKNKISNAHKLDQKYINQIIYIKNNNPNCSLKEISIQTNMSISFIWRALQDNNISTTVDLKGKTWKIIDGFRVWLSKEKI